MLRSPTKESSMDPISKLLAHFVSARFDHLSPRTVEAVKMTLLDTASAALAGSASEPGRGIARIAKRYGGAAGSTLIAHGTRVATPMAALANGVMARCCELDGTHETGGGHVGVSIVPAALALAETAARLFGLGEQRMLDAVGLAYASCSGNVQPTVEGAWSLWTPAGAAAAAGILAIDMAREGFVGSRNPLLGGFGLYRLYFRGDYDEEALLGDLGVRNEIVNNSLKPSPTCKYTHHAIATTLELVCQHGLTPEQVRRVTVATNTMGATQCGFDAAGAPKTKPLTPGAAKFSIPFTVAAAIAHRRVTLEEFTEEAIRDAGLLALAARVETRVDPAKDALPMLYPPMDVRIETIDGRVLVGCEQFVKGHPEHPFTMSHCVERFMDWAGAGVRPIAR